MATRSLSARAATRTLCKPPKQFIRTHTTSVDPAEVSHFNSLASTWWDPHGSSRLLHLMNPIRHQFIQRCLRQGPPAAEDAPLSYLDVGCGGGILAESLARLQRTGSVLGIDASPAVISVATAHARCDPLLRGKLRYLNAPAEGLREGPFDVVTIMEVVEHVPRPAEFLTATMAHVKPGGWLALSTIARTWTSYVTTKLVAEDILGLVPRGTHDWKKFINCDELREFFAGKGGWGEVLVMGCVYVPGLGWREVAGGEKIGNYFLGVRREAR